MGYGLAQRDEWTVQLERRKRVMTALGSLRSAKAASAMGHKLAGYLRPFGTEGCVFQVTASAPKVHPQLAESQQVVLERYVEPKGGRRIMRRHRAWQRGGRLPSSAEQQRCAPARRTLNP